MPIANINVDVNEKEIKAYLDEKLEESLRDTLIFWDVKSMASRMCMSESFLEQNILHDPRMRLLERRKAKGKRFWFYKESLEVIKQIVDEW